MLALTILFDGIIYASWLFIVALGLTLIFGVLKILNIAHGSFYAVGAYVTASFVAWSVGAGMSPAWSLLFMLLAALRRWQPLLRSALAQQFLIPTRLGDTV